MGYNLLIQPMTLYQKSAKKSHGALQLYKLPTVVASPLVAQLALSFLRPTAGRVHYISVWYRLLDITSSFRTVVTQTKHHESLRSGKCSEVCNSEVAEVTFWNHTSVTCVPNYFDDFRTFFLRPFWQTRGYSLV